MSKPKILIFQRRGTIVENDTPLISFQLPPAANTDETKILKFLHGLVLAQPNPADPISQAILKVAQAHQVPIQAVKFFKKIEGLGLAGVIENHALIFGSFRLMKESSLECPLELIVQASRQEEKYRRVLYVGWEGFVRALVIFQEKDMEEVHDFIPLLRSAYGIKECILLSGASEKLARATALKFGSLASYHFDKTPSEKKSLIKKYQDKNKPQEVLILEPRVSLAMLARIWQLRRLARQMALSSLVLMGLIAGALFFSSCKQNNIPYPSTITGRITLGESGLEITASQPNSVCYLIAKDQWGVPVIVKRWLNPKFPILFELRSSDLQLSSRPWKGPYHLEAYFYLSNNPEQELPPPQNAAKKIHKELLYPGNSPPVELSLNR